MDVDPELKNYVKEMRDNGFSDEEAKKKLLDAGWDPDDVTSALGLTTIETPAMPERPAPPTGQPSTGEELGVFALLEKSLNFMSKEIPFWLPFFWALFGIYVVQTIISSLLAYSVIGIVPTAGFEGMTQAMMAAQSSPSFGYSLITFVVNLVIYFVSLVIVIGFLKGITIRLTGKEFSLSEGIGAGKRKMFTAFIATIIFAIAVGFGLIFLIIPGLYLVVVWILFMPAIAIGDKGIFSSLGESKRLITGRWWRSFFLGVMYILCAIAYMIPVGIVLLIVGGILGVVFGGLFSGILYQIILNGLALPISLFMYVLMAMFYLNLKENTPEAA